MGSNGCKLSTETLPFQKHSDTSREAARLATPNAGTYRRMVLEALRDATEGLTDLELQERTGLEGSTERPRRIELVTAGVVRDSGTKRKTPSGRAATVWEIAQ